MVMRSVSDRARSCASEHESTSRNETKSHSRDMVRLGERFARRSARISQEGASWFECRCVLCRCLSAAPLC